MRRSDVNMRVESDVRKKCNYTRDYLCKCVSVTHLRRGSYVNQEMQ